MKKSEIAVKVFGVIFGIIFVIMAAIMIKGYIDDKNDDSLQVSRYESMKSADGKTVLTAGILEEDHDKYVKDVTKARNTFLRLVICFGTVMVSFVIMIVFNTVMKGIEGERGPKFTMAIVSAVSVLAIFVGVIVVSINVIVPNFNSSDPASEPYYFATLELVDSKKDVVYVEVDNGDSRTTEARTSYYLIEEDGNFIEVNELLYDRYEGPGVYYAGRTSKGNIFSLYPDKYFMME